MDQDDRFEALYRRYYPRVVEYLVAVQGITREEARDVAQDAFLRMLAIADQYSLDQEWTFVRTIAARVAMNRVRDKRAQSRGVVEREVTPADRISNLPGESAPQEKAFATAEATARLYAAISALPASHRTTLLLWLSDLTFEEIAQALRLSLSAVKSRLHAARRELRGLLSGDVPSSHLAASAERSDLVPAYARQKLVEASALASAIPVDQAVSQLTERVDALVVQQQQLSRQIDEYDEMLRRHLATVTTVEAAQRRGSRSAM